MAGEKITKKEREAAISLLITVFEMHEEEPPMNKALDDFLCCYGAEIPEWMQCLYNHFGSCDDNKTQIIKNFAKKHSLKIRNDSK